MLWNTHYFHPISCFLTNFLNKKERKKRKKDTHFFQLKIYGCPVLADSLSAVQPPGETLCQNQGQVFLATG